MRIPPRIVFTGLETCFDPEPPSPLEKRKHGLSSAFKWHFNEADDLAFEGRPQLLPVSLHEVIDNNQTLGFQSRKEAAGRPVGRKRDVGGTGVREDAGVLFGRQRLIQYQLA